MNQSLRRGLTGLCFLLVVLFLSNCSNKDEETLDPYQFQEEEFEAVPDLPDVEDPDPVIIEPELGEVVTSPSTTSVLDDLINAGSEGDINAGTKGSLDDILDYSNGFSAEIRESAKTLDEATIDAILDPSKPLTGIYKELQDHLASAPGSIIALLPKVNYSEDYSFLDKDIQLPSAELNKEFPSESTVKRDYAAEFGPCQGAAIKAYDKKVENLMKQRDEAVAKAQKNYERRVEDAEDRYDSRMAKLDKERKERIATLKITVLALNGVADQIGKFSPELGAVLKYFTIIYAVYGRQQIDLWYERSEAMLKVALLQEKLDAIEARDECIYEIQMEFEKCVFAADKVLKKALAACHNQGSGS